jgi:hypothetical protein
VGDLQNVLASLRTTFVEDSQLVNVCAEAARGAVVPLDEALELVRVMDGAVLRDAVRAPFDAIAD